LIHKNQILKTLQLYYKAKITSLNNYDKVNKVKNKEDAVNKYKNIIRIRKKGLHQDLAQDAHPYINKKISNTISPRNPKIKQHSRNINLQNKIGNTHNFS